MKTNPVLVVGGGPVGLIQALYLSRVRRLPVVVLEQQANVGGLYASVKTRWGLADQGVHIPSETGESKVDDLFFEILPRDQWHILEGARKDIAGNFFSGRLDQGSLYPDLRRLPDNEYRQCLGEIFEAVTDDPPRLNEVQTLREFFCARFGPLCTKSVMEGIAQKIWKQPLERLSPWAAKIVHLARVVTHDSRTTSALKASKPLDAVIGFPDQLRVPAELLANSQCALYPREYGLSHVVNGLNVALKREGVRLITASSVAKLEENAGRIRAVHLNNTTDKSLERLEVDSVVWTSPLAPLARLVGISNTAPPDAPIPHRVVYLFLNRPPHTGELYWLWCYDQSDSLVRVSVPHAFCPDAAKSGVYPVCAEMHVADEALPDGESISLAESQLRGQQLIGEDTAVIGGCVLPGNRSFFVPTVANCDAMAAQRTAVTSTNISNLILATQDISAGVFYMPEILRSSLMQLNEI